MTSLTHRPRLFHHRRPGPVAMLRLPLRPFDPVLPAKPPPMKTCAPLMLDAGLDEPCRLTREACARIGEPDGVDDEAAVAPGPALAP